MPWKLVITFYYKSDGYDRADAVRYPESFVFSNHLSNEDIVKWLIENTSYDVITDDFFVIHPYEPKFAI